VLTTWDQYDVRAKAKRCSAKSYVARGPKITTLSPFPTSLAGADLVAVSRSGRRMVVVRRAESGDSTGSVLETWDSGALRHSVLIDRTVYCDGLLGAIAFDAAETSVLLIAEARSVSTTSSLKAPTSFEYTADWGELYDGKCRPTPCLVRLDSGALVQLGRGAIAASKLTCGQPQFSPCGEYAVFVGWHEEPTKLGLVYCEQRKSALYAVPVAESASGGAGALVCLTPHDAVARSPRFSPNGQWIAYLAADRAPTHGVCSRLRVAEWRRGGGGRSDGTATSPPLLVAPSTICEVVNAPADANAFPGLFVRVLPPHCWLELGAAERGGEVGRGSGSRGAEEKAAASPPQLAIATSSQWGECSFIYRYISRESCSQFDSLP
jgi:acylaminoacyl-peptidase